MSVTLDREAEGMGRVESEGLLLPPLGTGLLRFEVTGVHDPDFTEAVFLRMQAPENSRRRLLLPRIEESYLPGDSIPEFRLPGVESCTGGVFCDPTPRCVEYPSEEFEGTPMILAFWSTW